MGCAPRASRRHGATGVRLRIFRTDDGSFNAALKSGADRLVARFRI